MGKEKLVPDTVKDHIDSRLTDLVTSAVTKAVSDLGINKEIKDDNDDVVDTLEKVGSIIRRRKFELKEGQVGIAAARMVRCLAFAKGDMNRAKYFAQRAFEDDLGDEITKALTATDHSAGGALVPPEYAAEIIELLRSKTVVRAAGARQLPMNNGSMTIRKQTSGSSASYVGESQNIPATETGTGQIDLVSKKLAAIVPISNDLLAFTSGPSADEFVRDDLVMEMSIREDRAFLRDDGTEHTPKGMRHWAANVNVSASNGTSSDNIETDLKELINALEGADVRLLRPAWFMHPRTKNHLRNLRDANGNLIFPEIRSTSPTIYGWPVFVTTSIPSNLGVGGDESEIYFADMVDALIGEVSAMEITVDPSASYHDGSGLQSAFSRDETVVRSISRHDFAMRHAESVAVKNSVVWGA